MNLRYNVSVSIIWVIDGLIYYYCFVKTGHAHIVRSNVVGVVNIINSVAEKIGDYKAHKASNDFITMALRWVIQNSETDYTNITYEMTNH